MSSTKCPVCGNPGVSDYLNENIVCPHCGSDLSIYRTLSDISNNYTKPSGNTNRFILLLVIVPIILVLIGSVSIVCLSRSRYQSQMVAKDESIEALKDSIDVLYAAIESRSVSTPSTIDYIVVKGDCPWSVVLKVFGYRKDWADIYTQIAQDNQIWDTQREEWIGIHPGQILSINKDL